jgi:uncharacterized lipoprotein YajG
MKTILYVALLACVTACTLTPQKVQVMPLLSFPQLSNLTTPMELMITDNRKNTQLLGYRNAKQEGEIQFKVSLVQSLGESMQQAMLAQNVTMQRGGEAFTKLTLQIDKLHYSTPDESWVSRVKLDAEISVLVSRNGSSFKKRFSANRSQDVAIAPSEEFNEKYLNALLSEIINKAMNDRDVINFLK